MNYVFQPFWDKYNYDYAYDISTYNDADYEEENYDSTVQCTNENAQIICDEILTVDSSEVNSTNKITTGEKFNDDCKMYLWLQILITFKNY